jgi:manganese transport protein
VLTNRASVMKSFVSARRTRIAGWCAVGIILTLNVVLLGQMALGH